MGQPSRWDKDRMFEKRCREEGIRLRSKVDVKKDVKVMTFGKFEGVPVSEVNTKYLRWLVNNLDYVPDYIAIELDKRHELKGMPKEKKKRLRNLVKSRKNEEKKKVKCKSSGSVSVGREYEWLRAEWEDAGGDSSECPFGEDYAGPRLLWENDEWVIYVNVQHGQSDLLSTE